MGPNPESAVIEPPHVSVLENGLTVATFAMPQMASVSVGLWFGVGSRHEPARLNGVCHFIEHLLFKGTTKRSAQEISQAVEGLGGSLNAFTNEEMTCFHARAGHERLEELIEVLMDMLADSRFAPADIAKEREVIFQELAMFRNEPEHYVEELLMATTWPDQPLGRPVAGEEKTLAAMRRGDLVGYLTENYLANAAVLAVAGKLIHQEVVRLAARHSRRRARGPRPPFASARDQQQSPRVKMFTKPGDQAHLALGIRSCSRHDPRRFAWRLLNIILGENMSSRLFQVIREDRGLAYSVSSALNFFHDTGSLVIAASLDTDNFVKTMRLVMRELRRMSAAPVTGSELQRAKEYVCGQMDLALENTEDRMNWLGEDMINFGKLFAPAEIKRGLCAVTAAEIRAVAHDFFRPHKLNMAVISPLKSPQRLSKLLDL